MINVNELLAEQADYRWPPTYSVAPHEGWIQSDARADAVRRRRDAESKAMHVQLAAGCNYHDDSREC